MLHTRENKTGMCIHCIWCLLVIYRSVEHFKWKKSVVEGNKWKVRMKCWRQSLDAIHREDDKGIMSGNLWWCRLPALLFKHSEVNIKMWWKVKFRSAHIQYTYSLSVNLSLLPFLLLLPLLRLSPFLLSLIFIAIYHFCSCIVHCWHTSLSLLLCPSPSYFSHVVWFYSTSLSTTSM